LNMDGSLSSILVAQEKLEVPWKTPSGEIFPFSCGKKLDSEMGGKVSRMVTFFPSGEIREGCDGLRLIFHKTANGSRIQALGRMGFSEKFELVYSNMVYTGDVKVGDVLLPLVPRSEIDFHPNGNPHFFTMKHGQKFVVDQPLYGKLEIQQKDEKEHAASNSLFEDGSLETGILSQDLVHKHIPDMKIPAGSGVRFDPDDHTKIYNVLFASPQDFKTKDYGVRKIKFIVWYEKQNLYRISVTETFTVVDPVTQKKLEVTPGSVLNVNSKTLEITGGLINGSTGGPPPP
jgi:hypothetical protein